MLPSLLDSKTALSSSQPTIVLTTIVLSVPPECATGDQVDAALPFHKVFARKGVREEKLQSGEEKELNLLHGIPGRLLPQIYQQSDSSTSLRKSVNFALQRYKTLSVRSPLASFPPNRHHMYIQPPPEQRGLGLASPPAKKQRLCSQCKQPGHNKEAALESLYHSNLLHYTYLLCHY